MKQTGVGIAVTILSYEQEDSGVPEGKEDFSLPFSDQNGSLAQLP
jgi:hypothetical protein